MWHGVRFGKALGRAVYLVVGLVLNREHLLSIVGRRRIFLVLGCVLECSVKVLPLLSLLVHLGVGHSLRRHAHHGLTTLVVLSVQVLAASKTAYCLRLTGALGAVQYENLYAGLLAAPILLYNFVFEWRTLF